MKEIQLSQGQSALVDDEDYDFLIQWKWHARKAKVKGKEYSYYARRNVWDGATNHTILMHREILCPANDEWIDHKDRNGLNNQRKNLRFCNRFTNAFNQETSNQKTKSKYRGVTQNKGCKSFVATLVYKGKRFYLGSYSSAKEAALAWNEAAIRYYGEFARLNIIE